MDLSGWGMGQRECGGPGSGDLTDLDFSVLFLLFLDREDRYIAGLDWVSPEDLNGV